MSIYFNGVSSDTHGVIVQHRPNMIHAQRVVSTVSVPGRNGDLVIDEGRYANYTQSYDIFTRASRGQIQEHITDLSPWLLGPAGYCRLVDTYEPDYYRMARFIGPINAENLVNTVGTCTLEFDCMPQRWLLTGETAVTVTTSGTRISNPTQFNARPLIRAYGTGSFTIGSTQIVINSANTYTDIDCELQDAYHGTDNCNGNIEVDEFPVLTPGVNTITFSGLTRLDITPRWWTI